MQVVKLSQNIALNTSSGLIQLFFALSDSKSSLLDTFILKLISALIFHFLVLDFIFFFFLGGGDCRRF